MTKGAYHVITGRPGRPVGKKDRVSSTELTELRMTEPFILEEHS